MVAGMVEVRWCVVVVGWLWRKGGGLVGRATAGGGDESHKQHSLNNLTHYIKQARARLRHYRRPGSRGSYAADDVGASRSTRGVIRGVYDD